MEEFCKECLISDFAEFKKWLEFKGLSPNTIKSYFSDIKQSLSFFFDGSPISLEDLLNYSVNDWRALFSHFHENNKKATTQQRVIAAWKKWAKFKKLSNFQVSITKIRYPKLEEKIPRSVNFEEIKSMLNEKEDWQNLRNNALIILLYGTGIRINEALNLKWSDFSNNCFDDNDDAKYCRIAGKGNKIRFVPILNETANFLKKYKDALSEKLKYVFVGNSLKSKWHACSVARLFRKIILEKNLPKITPHSLRHSCATHLLKSGCNLRNIQNLLGHSNLETTKVYVKYPNHELRRIYEKAIKTD